MAQRTDHRLAVERRLLLAAKHIYRRLAAEPHRCCLLICGMQRSGTNMVMDVLERSFATEVFHETDPRAYHRYELLDHATLHRLIAASRSPVVVFKALLESDLVVQLLDELAPAKAIWALRDWRDVVNSAKRSFPILRTTVAAIVQRPGQYWQSRGVSPAVYRVLSAHFRDDLSIESSAALFWYARNRLYLDNRLDRDPRVLLVRYEELVSRPTERFRDMFELVGIPYRPGVTRRVHSRSVSRLPPPQIEPEIAELCEGLYIQFPPPRGEVPSLNNGSWDRRPLGG